MCVLPVLKLAYETWLDGYIINVFQIKKQIVVYQRQRENILPTLLRTSVWKFIKIHRDCFILSSVDYAVQRQCLSVHGDLFIQTQTTQICNTVHFRRVDFVLNAIYKIIRFATVKRDTQRFLHVYLLTLFDNNL